MQQNSLIYALAESALLTFICVLKCDLETCFASNGSEWRDEKLTQTFTFSWLYIMARE